MADIDQELGTPQTLTIKSPKDITRENYQDLIMTYNLHGFPPTPIPWKTISTPIIKDGVLDGNAHTANSKELAVPDGYISKLGAWLDLSAYWNDHPRPEVAIGNKIFRLIDNNGALGAIDNHYKSTEGNPIQVSVNSYDIASYTLNVYAAVELTNEALEKWQIEIFGKIMTAYNAIQSEYKQRISAQEFQGGVAIHGQNPLINREIEKTELQKHCIKMLIDTYQFASFDATRQKRDEAPDFDFFDALEEGIIIQFFEQAFEWENITYLFYPYFWGRKDEWIHKSTTYDIDPLFTKFLQAGSARVVIPVHPAYNDAILYYLATGAIWQGGDAPKLNDPLFISIHEELKNQIDDLASATPEGDPCDVILPTTLVYLQKESDLPTF